MRRISTFLMVGAAALALSLRCAGAIEIEVHAPQIHPTTVHTPKVSTPTNTSTTTTTTQNQSTANLNIKPWSAPPAGGGKYPQGVQINAGNGDKVPTVTIDGKTMPMNANTQKLVQEAITPPPKMWQNGQLVPVPTQ